MSNDVTEPEVPAEPDAPVDAGAPTSTGRPRKVFAVVMVVLATVLFLASTIAVWAKRTVLSPDRVVAAVDAAIDDPAVAEALAVKITDQLVQLVDVDTILQDVLPAQLDALAPVIQSAVRDIIQKQVTAVVSSDAGKELLGDAVRQAHKAALRLLEGDGLAPDSVFSMVDGQVTLDVVPLVVRTVELLQQNGIISDRFDLTEVAQKVTTNEKVAALSGIFGVKVPDNFGQIVILDSAKVDEGAATLASAQRAMSIFQKGTTLLVILALLSIAGAIWLSVDRRRTLAQLSLAIGLGALVLRIGIDKVVEAIDKAIDKVGIRHAAVNMTESLTESLARTLVTLAIVGIVVGVLVRLLRPNEDGSASSFAGLVHSHAFASRLVVIALCVLLLAVVGIAWLTVIIIGALGVAGVLYVNRNAVAAT